MTNRFKVYALTALWEERNYKITVNFIVYFDGKFVIILRCQIRPFGDFPRSLKTSQHSGNKHSFWRQFYVIYF